VLKVGGHRFATPFLQGEVRVMTYTWNEAGLLTQLEDDDDNDGVPESRVTLVYDDRGQLVTRSLDMGADGQIDEVLHFDKHEVTQYYSPSTVTNIWSRCQGVCSYDVHGNMLEDRATSNEDVLTYDYSCWVEGAQAQ